MISRPTVQEERQVLLNGRAQAWLRSGFIDEPARERIRERTQTRWKPSSLFSRLVFFALTLICIAAFFNLLKLTDVPAAGLLTALASLAIAEFLILSRRFFHIGPEEALYIGGLVALVLDLQRLGDERLLLLALAAAAAGFRVLNDLFLALALALIGFYLGARTDSGTAAAVFCVGAALAAMWLLTRPIERPLWARTLASTIFVLPAVGYAILKFHPFGLHGITVPAMISFALIAAVFLVVGMMRRIHSAIFSAMIVLALVLADLGDRIAWRAEIELLFWGIASLLLALMIERALRTPRHGITSHPLVDPASVDLLEAAGIGALGVPAASAEPREGGEFGGGGASGRY